MKLAAVISLAALVLAGSALARPGTPPPDVQGTTSEPPPAWIRAATVERWLAYDSFCWKTACVDFLPAARRTDLPRVRARAGASVTIHLGFDPTAVRVRVLATGRTYPLVAARVTRWRVRALGVVSVEARGAGGSAAYLARVTG